VARQELHRETKGRQPNVQGCNYHAAQTLTLTLQAMNSLTLRNALSTDNEFAYAAKKSAFKEYVDQVWGWDEAEPAPASRRTDSRPRTSASSTWRSRRRIIAVVAEPDCTKLNQLFILPEHQGKGIGRACMERIMEEAQQRRVPCGCAC